MDGRQKEELESKLLPKVDLLVRDGLVFLTEGVDDIIYYFQRPGHFLTISNEYESMIEA